MATPTVPILEGDLPMVRKDTHSYAYQKARREEKGLAVMEVPRDLHRLLKVQAAEKGLTMPELLRELLAPASASSAASALAKIRWDRAKAPTRA